MKPLYLAGIPKSKRPLFVPDFSADSITDVDFKALSRLGVRHIIIDLDLTLRRKMTWKLEPVIHKYIIDAKKDFGFKSISIATNNMLNVRNYGQSLEAQIFQPFWRGLLYVRKPSRFFYEKILKTLNAKPGECVMIGDKLRGDVYGGNHAGMFTVQVKPRGRDYWYDKILFTRFRERRMLGKFIKF